MKWLISLLTSSIGRKVLMAITGLGLVLFLVGHLSGNFLLLKGDQGEAFNLYAYFMNHNPLVQVARYAIYIGILLHVVVAYWLARKNAAARPVGYKVKSRSANSMWNARNMVIVGTVVLFFLVIHMRAFWFEYKWGSIGTQVYDGVEVKDLYAVTAAAFSQAWYVALYVVCMVALALHLAHGIQSSFRTMGGNHPKYMPIIKLLGMGFAIVVPTLFASIPVIMLLNS